MARLRRPDPVECEVDRHPRRRTRVRSRAPAATARAPWLTLPGHSPPLRLDRRACRTRRDTRPDTAPRNSRRSHPPPQRNARTPRKVASKFGFDRDAGRGTLARLAFGRRALLVHDRCGAIGPNPVSHTEIGAGHVWRNRPGLLRWPTLVAGALLVWSSWRRPDVAAALLLLGVPFVLIEHCEAPSHPAFGVLRAGRGDRCHRVRRRRGPRGTRPRRRARGRPSGRPPCRVPSRCPRYLAQQPGWFRWAEAFVVSEVSGYWGHRMSHESLRSGDSIVSTIPHRNSTGWHRIGVTRST